MFKLSRIILKEATYQDIITYPEIRKLKGKYRLTDQDFSNITGDKCYQTFTRKLDCKSEFTPSDMINIYNYFKDLGEEVTIQELFFDWIFSNEKLAV